jgi:hypothetical protein
VIAGRRNRSKRPALSVDARQRLREAAIRNQPWLKSTGPTSNAGKAIVAMNGRGRQKGPRSVRQIRADLADVTELIGSLKETIRMVGGVAN